MKFSHSFCVANSDIDEHNHVNNVAYLRWIQEVALAHWVAEATPEMKKKYKWFVLRHEIDYKNRAFEGEEITSLTWDGKATKITCERYTEIRRCKDFSKSQKHLVFAQCRNTKTYENDSGAFRSIRYGNSLRVLF